MSIGVDEDAGVAAPERLRPGSADPCARDLRLGDYGIDLRRRADIVGERDPAPPSRVVDRAVLGERLAAPERDDEAARLEEDDVVVRSRLRLPPERLVERAGA